MPLQHDSQGFLLGDPLNVDALIEEWRRSDAKIGAIQQTLFKIERLLESGAASAGKESARAAGKADDNKPSPSTPRAQARDSERKTVAPSARRIRENEETQSNRSAAVVPAAVKQRSLANEATVPTKTVEEVAPASRNKDASEGQPAPQPALKSQPQAVEPKPRASQRKPRSEEAAQKTPTRDAKGRFVGKGADNGEGGESAAQRNLEDSAMGRFASRIADAVKGEADQAGQADPVVEAFKEVAEPIGRGVEIFGAFKGDGKDEQNSWLKRISNTLTGIRGDNSAYQTAQDRRLKAIEKTAAANGGSAGGGIMSGIGGILGQFAPVLAGFAKRIPLIGAALAGVKGLFGIWASETNDDLSRDEKDKRTGSAVGGAAGSIGGAFAGAKAGAAIGSMAGPIGTIVGGILGSVGGLVLGDAIGKKAGEWGGQIVSFFRDVPGNLEKSWDGLVASVSASWSAVTDKVSKTWEGLKDTASETFDKIGETFGVENASEKLSNAVSSAAAAVGGAFTSAKTWVSDLFLSDEEKAERNKAKKLEGITANPYDMRTEGEDWEYFEAHRAAGEKAGMSPQRASAAAKHAMEGKDFFHMSNEEYYNWRLQDMPLRSRTEALVTARSVREEALAKEDAELAAKGTEGWSLGQTSARFESGGRGAATISSGRGDHGGASYGTYQLSSKTGTLNDFLQSSGYALSFEGMKPGSKEFNAQWRSLAQTDPNFAKAQHNYIKETHFDPAMTSLKRAGIDLSGRGAAVQDMVWSTANQFGAGNAKRGSGGAGLIRKAIGRRNIEEMTDEEIISAVQDYKLANNAKLFKSSSASVQRGTANRAAEEKKQLLALARQEKLAPKKAQDRTATMIAEGGKSEDAADAVPKAEPQGPALYARNADRKRIKGYAKLTHDSGIPTAELSASPQTAANFYQSLIASPSKAPAAASVAAAAPPVLPPQAPAPAPAQPVATPLTSGGGEKQAVVRVEGDVGQDMKERGIAHIATGGMV